MEQEELLGWVNDGYMASGRAAGLGDDWWPAGNAAQRQATTWVWGIVAALARDRCFGRRLICHANLGADQPSQAARERIIEELWPNPRRLRVEPGEVLVDFSVHDWDSARPILLTAESEMYAAHGVHDALDNTDDYSWDFYKLLLMPSPLRLFVARVGAVAGELGSRRRNRLERSLTSIYNLYSAGLLAATDELGIVILPRAARDWRDLRLLWRSRGRLRNSRPWRNA